MAATTPIEDIAAAGGPLWFQLYPQPDLAFTAAVVRRAERAGCRALVVTVDSPVFGRRERDRRNGFTDLPAGLVCENMRDDTGRVRDIVMDAELGWDRIDWLRGHHRAADRPQGTVAPGRRGARGRARGVRGLLVSNHGGRQLDGVLSTVDALPAVVKAVGGRLPILLDGGIRRGADILAASRWAPPPFSSAGPCCGGSPRTAATGCGRCSTCCARTWTGRSHWPGVRRPADLTGDLVAARC